MKAINKLLIILACIFGLTSPVYFCIFIYKCFLDGIYNKLFIMSVIFMIMTYVSTFIRTKNHHPIFVVLLSTISTLFGLWYTYECIQSKYVYYFAYGAFFALVSIMLFVLATILRSQMDNYEAKNTKISDDEPNK